MIWIGYTHIVLMLYDSIGLCWRPRLHNDNTITLCRVYSAYFDQELTHSHGLALCQLAYKSRRLTDFGAFSLRLFLHWLVLIASGSTMNMIAKSIVLVVSLAVLSEAHPHGKLTHSHNPLLMIMISNCILGRLPDFTPFFVEERCVSSF